METGKQVISEDFTFTNQISLILVWPTNFTCITNLYIFQKENRNFLEVVVKLNKDEHDF